MKKTLILLSFAIISLGINAQYSRATIWTGAINGFAAEDAVNGAPKDVVLFAGSSTFTNWSSVKTDFPDSPILNRAFGGSWMTDLIYYFNQVVLPYNPKQVVLYEGDNDLIEANKTAEDFFDDVVTMTRLINIYFPNAKILLVSVKPSPSRTAYFDKYKAANTLMKNYADKISYIEYADTWTPMLNNDGSPNSSLFGSDMLHMNSTGYAIWKTVLKPFLLTGTTTVNPTDKAIFTESSNATYHEYTWSNVTAPSIFNTVKAEKISCDSANHHNGMTSLKLNYQGVSGGSWKACVAAVNWTGYDISQDYNLEFWVNSSSALNGTDMPNLYLESTTGTTTGKLLLSNYVSSIPANQWTKVTIPVSDWKTLSPAFAYNSVKTIFFSQQNLNTQPITMYVDDVIYKIIESTPPISNNGNIFVDFGSTTATSSNNWNNVTDTQAANTLLIDKDGASTGITLKITDPFYNGYNTNGTSSPAGNAADLLATATQDNFFGHALDWSTTPANPLAVIELSGLSPVKYYGFSFFGSRTGVSDNRETLFSVTGLNTTKTATLDAANNTSNVAIITDLIPTADGKLTIKVEAGANNNSANKFFYLGAMKVSVSDTPSGSNAPSINKINVYYSKDTLHVGDLSEQISIFDFTGKKIANGLSETGNFRVKLPKGVYIVEISNQITKFIVN